MHLNNRVRHKVNSKAVAVGLVVVELIDQKVLVCLVVVVLLPIDLANRPMAVHHHFKADMVVVVGLVLHLLRILRMVQSRTDLCQVVKRGIKPHKPMLENLNPHQNYFHLDLVK